MLKIIFDLIEKKKTSRVAVSDSGEWDHLKDLYPSVKHKHEAINWARNVLSTPDEWVILDTETTGINNNDVVIQIGVIDLNEQILLDTLLRPTKRKRMSKEATNIHGITMRMLTNAPTLREIIDTLIDICQKKKIIIYNAEFDTKLLTQTAYQDNIQISEGKWVVNCECAMYHYSRFAGKWSNYHQNYTYQKLPFSEHNSIGDCKATLKLIRMMANTEIEKK
jgi:DNA polymerase-3 subunit epsilon